MHIEGWIQSGGFCSFDQRIKESAGMGTTCGNGEQPVFPAYHKWSNAIFYLVVIDRDLWAIKESR